MTDEPHLSARLVGDHGEEVEQVRVLELPQLRRFEKQTVESLRAGRHLYIYGNAAYFTV